jgi:hypothetical protein
VARALVRRGSKTSAETSLGAADTSVCATTEYETVFAKSST